MSVPQSNQQFLILRVIWGALLLTPLIFFFVLKTILQGREEVQALETMTGNVQPLQLFGGIAAMLFVGSFLVIPVILKGMKPQVLEAGTDETKRLQIFTTPFIMRMALTEAIAVFGFLVANQQGLSAYYPFMAASMLAALLAFPSMDQINRRMDEIQNQG